MRKLLHLYAITVMLMASVAGNAMGQTGISPHGELSVACAECHTTESWIPLRSPLAFSHDSTSFPLTGGHVEAACVTCHASRKFSDAKNQCSSCHSDIHSGQFAHSCESCHTTDGWTNRDRMYEHHATTRFALLGRHAQAECRMCHAADRYAGISTECAACHFSEYEATNEPNHVLAGFPVRCDECHRITAESWRGVVYSHTDRFPLTNAHAGPNCSACHRSGAYAATSSTCYSCHETAYTKTRNPDHQAAQISRGCEECHGTSTWRPSSFHHEETAFALTGAHLTATCQQCHIQGQFTGTSPTCFDCHRSDYEDAQTLDHESAQIPRTCEDCHTTDEWSPSSFSHSATAFPLTGAHLTTACQQCHVNGQFAGTAAECFVCHEVDYTRAAAPNHAAAQIPHECLECHNTGGWTPSSFDHAATAFALTGSHRIASCQQCHIGGQFAGTPTECFSCHESDYNATVSPDHQAALLPQECTQCHTTESWTPSSFDHAATAFPLTGAHLLAACQQCHADGQFPGIASGCVDCHRIPYEQSTNPNHQAAGFSTECSSCHTTSDWDTSFDHSALRFPLAGAHTSLSCVQCHAVQYAGTPATCYGCHQTNYEGASNPDHASQQFPHSCTECHTENVWSPSTFSHPLTGFPLTGAHTRTRCGQCHTDGRFANTPRECFACHEPDYIRVESPDHAAGRFPHACTDCHSTGGWIPSSFDHTATSFPLTGTHLTTSCQQCHIGGQFAGTPTECFSCHEGNYNATISPDHQAAQLPHECTECHTTGGWTPSSFDHAATAFPLTGTHLTTLCQQCHVGGQFAGTPTECFSCHEANYNGTISPDHQAAQLPHECQECHTTAGWTPSSFDHAATAFPLTGTHLTTLCQQCHIGGQFAGTPTECFSCHEGNYNATISPDHQAAQLPHECTECHTTGGWTPSSFDHAATAFPLTGTHLTTLCQQCHIGGQFAGTPTECFSCHEGNYNATVSPDHQAAQLPHECAECHTTGGWTPSSFDHAATAFPLTGTHLTTSCQQCHVGGQFAGTPTECFSCHEGSYNATVSPDHQAAQLPHECTECHTTVSWTPSSFDHAATTFPLTGAHVTAVCQQCHVGGQFAGTPSECFACHEGNYNATVSPDHQAAQLPHECTECHSTVSWTPSSFDHAATAFPLTGAHLTSLCQQCHIGGQFAGTPTECFSCHQTDYNSTTDPNHTAAQLPHLCNLCHTTAAWQPSEFNHNLTGFPLTGAHVNASCQQCHVNGQFAGTPTACFSCHEASYNSTSAPDHQAAQLPHECTECHSTNAWMPSSFDHAGTAFPLTGAHVTAVCQQCHVGGQFAGTPSTCLACHIADFGSTSNPNHAAAGFPATCQTCHTTTNWESPYDHSQTGFLLTGAHTNAECSQCHIGDIYQGLPSDCWSCHQTDYNSASDPNHTTGQLPHSCQSCHSTTAWEPSTFSHNSTDFPLTGAHTAASCQQCHVNGQFSGTPTNCFACHQSDYNGTSDPNHAAAGFPTTCQACHTTSNWDATFNHNQTDFPLTGAHVAASCLQCHASGQYNGLSTDCFACHQSDYNGTSDPNHAAAGFPITCVVCHTTSNWDASFNHNQTDFPLTGAHISANCNQCHVNGQFSGTPSQCSSCHIADYNTTTNPNHAAAGFPTTCQTCHTTSNWDASFDHGQTDFPLTGAHVSTSCLQCHASGQYSGTPTDCFACHQADYNGTTSPDHEVAQFPHQCAECHTTAAWLPATFNHNTTGFPLTGAHVSANCNQCHVNGQYAGTPTDCFACHQSDYNGTSDPNHAAAGFPFTCQTCHTTSNWDATFNHNQTDFPLTGAHVSANCNQCHVNGQYAGTPTECFACHQSDYNGTSDPNHAAAGFPFTCQTCHTTSNWDATFNHNQTDFPLTGAHVSANCNQCHVNGQYAGTPTECFACHQSDYNGTSDPNHAAAGFPTACAVCHTTSSWEADFDHGQTDFPLTGAHVAASCLQCHASGQYNGLSTECFACHQSDYNGTTDPNHAAAGFPTTCAVCHTTSSWDASFDHGQTDFPLTGAHVSANCNQCHVNGQYAGTPTECFACHQSDYNGTSDPNHAAAGFPTTCVACHNTSNWDATFDHDNLYFPIYSGEHRREWDRCSDCHVVPNNFAIFSCIDCHEHNRQETDGHHNGVQGYVYQSSACYACHPDGRE